MYAAGAMGIASFLQILTVAWVLQMIGRFDIATVLDEHRFLTIVMVLLLMPAHFFVARSLEREIPADTSGHNEVRSSRLGILYFAGSGLVYLVTVFTAFWLKWH